MQLSEIETKLNAKRKTLEKENAVLEKSRNKVSAIKNEIAELEKQIVSKKNEELLFLIKSKNFTIDEVIELVNSQSNTPGTNTSLKEKNIIKTPENNADGE